MAPTRATLEIIPDSRFIVFHGGEHEASPVSLKGIVRLTTPESMSITKPKIKLEGKRKVSWYYVGGLSTNEVGDKKVFWGQEQKLGGIESAYKIKAGVIEWPFEFELSPSMPESVEGLRGTYIAYHLSATVGRPGWNAKDIVAQEHIRIVRTLGRDSMEMTRSRVNADIWANKIAYSISIPTDAVVFGTSVTADVELSPIKKGVRMGKVELRMMETVVKRIQLSEMPCAADKAKSEETEVAKEDLEFPENSKVMYNDETIDSPMLADEMYKFKVTLPLPKSLNECRQDVDSHQINITHRFKLMVSIHNPEGHVSQLVCRLPVKIFISPNLPVNEQNQVVQVANGVSDETLNQTTQTQTVAPPQYGAHQLDQLYSDIDPTGYMSRPPSNPSSPSGPGAQSRSGSYDNLASLNRAANGGANFSFPNGQSLSLLESRLADLQAGEGRSPVGSLSYNVSGGTSPATGLASSQHPVDNTLTTVSISESGSLQTPNNYDIDNLSRVPSYNAALRAPGSITPYTEVPPTYVEATSRPPSPTTTAHLRRNEASDDIDNGESTFSGDASSENTASIQRPNQVHLQSVDRGRGSESSNRTVFGDIIPENTRAARPTRPSTVADDQARIRTLRAGT